MRNRAHRLNSRTQTFRPPSVEYTHLPPPSSDPLGPVVLTWIWTLCPSSFASEVNGKEPRRV